MSWDGTGDSIYLASNSIPYWRNSRTLAEGCAGQRCADHVGRLNRRLGHGD